MNRPKQMLIRACATALIIGIGLPAFRLSADEPKKPIDGKTALEKLKALAGDWKFVKGSGPGTEGQKVRYRVVGAGSAVVEEQFMGSDHEMVSVYHLDGDNLLMTHYCAAGNQPRMKLDLKNSTAETLVFAFDGGTNFDPAKDMHIHSAKIEIKDDKHVNSYWQAFQDGKAAGEPMAFVLERG